MDKIIVSVDRELFHQMMRRLCPRLLPPESSVNDLNIEQTAYNLAEKTAVKLADKKVDIVVE